MVEAISFRVAASRGERRWVRTAVAELLADGYLVEGPGYLRIKNFHRAQGREDIEAAPQGASRSTDQVATEHRPRTEPVATVSPSGIEPVTNRSRTGIEECGKYAESAAAGPPLPSVPSLPSVPALGEGDTPPATEQEPEPLPRAPEPRLDAPVVTAQHLLDTFGRLRSDVVGGMPWQFGGGGNYAKAQKMAASFDEHPAAAADIEPTMRLVLERSKESQDARDQNPAFAFGSWCSSFTALREQLHGLARDPRQPPARASPGGDVTRGWAGPSGNYGHGVQKL